MGKLVPLHLVKYRPRGLTGSYAPPLSAPKVECLGVSLVSRYGNTLRDDLCDHATFKVRDYGVDVHVANVSICIDCALTGRGLDGALFRITHETSDTLNAMQPQVQSLECDLGFLPGAGDNPGIDSGDSARRHLMQLSSGSDHSNYRRGLLQFLSSQSNLGEMNDYFRRTLPNGNSFPGGGRSGGDDGGSDGDGGGDGDDSAESKYALNRGNDDGDSSFGDWNGSNNNKKDRSGGDWGGTEHRNRSDGGKDNDEEEKDDEEQPLQQQLPPDDVARCVDDVGKLANNVQW